jgi:hypothetical protein
MYVRDIDFALFSRFFYLIFELFRQCGILCFITNTAWVHARFCKLQKGCTRLAAASDKVYQLLAHGRWFSAGTSASSTTKTGRHDIAEILQLKKFKKNDIV